MNKRKLALMMVILCISVSAVWAQTASQGYFVGINGQAAGPYSISDLRGLIQNGTMIRESLIWKEGMANWVEAYTVSEIASLFISGPPPLAGTRSNPIPLTSGVWVGGKITQATTELWYSFNVPYECRRSIHLRGVDLKYDIFFDGRSLFTGFEASDSSIRFDNRGSVLVRVYPVVNGITRSFDFSFGD